MEERTEEERVGGKREGGRKGERRRNKALGDHVFVSTVRNSMSFPEF